MKDRLRQLGISVTESFESCKYMAAPSILRTRKFVCAMAKGPTLLSTAYVEKCLAENKALDPADFPLLDSVGEKRYGMSLIDSVKRRSAGLRH